MTDPAELLKGFVDSGARSVKGVPLCGYLWRPLTEASFVLNLALTGPSIIPLRVVNLLIHILSAILVWLIAGRLGTLAGFARWAALFFALHPQAVQAVTYVYERGLALQVLMSCLCVLLYLKERRSWAWGAALLAMGTKESAVTLPLTLLALEWIWKGERSPRRLLARWTPFALLIVPVLVQVLRGQAGEARSGIATAAQEAGLSPLQYLRIELPVLVHYVRFCFLPFPGYFSHDWDTWRGPVPLLPSLVCGTLLLVVLAWVLFGPSRHRLPRLGAALFFAPLALESSVFPIYDVARSYRSYPGLLGAGLIFAWGMKKSRLLGATALLGLAALTAFENRLWREPLGLRRRDVRTAFHIPANWGNCGEQYLFDGHPAPAEVLTQQGMRLPVTSWVQDIHLRSLVALGRSSEAMEALARVEALFHDEKFICALALRVAEGTGDSGAEDRLLERMHGAVASDLAAGRMFFLPEPYPRLLFQRARALMGQGQAAQVEALLQRHEDTLGSQGVFWELLGAALLVQGRSGEAELAYRRAIALDGTLYQSCSNLGMLVFWRGDAAEGERLIRRATVLNPGAAKPWQALAEILRQEGRSREAAEADARARACTQP